LALALRLTGERGKRNENGSLIRECRGNGERTTRRGERAWMGTRIRATLRDGKVNESALKTLNGKHTGMKSALSVGGGIRKMQLQGGE
jgi:hypothetical protein